MQASPPPPELIVPYAAQAVDTTPVTRGPMMIVTRHSAIIRTRSEGLDFGPVAYYFGGYHVRHGDIVYEGQLIATLDQRRLREEITELENHIGLIQRINALDNEMMALDIEMLAFEYNQALLRAATAFDEAAMADAERIVFRVERMEMDLSLARERQAFNLRNDEEQLQQLRAQLRDFELRAPYDGMIIYLERIRQGTWLPALEAVAFIACLEAETFIDYFGHLPGPARTARIQAHINNNVYDLIPVNIENPEVRSYIAHGGPIPRRFTTENRDRLPIGAYAAIHAYTLWEEDTLRIPVNALFSDPQVGYYVQKIIDGQTYQVPVGTGARTVTFIEILDGLEEGDEVVVRS